MPDISVILGHPEKGSFNHAIAEVAVKVLQKNNYNVFFHDLYKEKFQPALPASEVAGDAEPLPEIQKYCREISISEGIIIIHPNWWGQPPAILKGWVDRVLRAGVAYRFLEDDNGEGIPRGLLKAKAAIVFNTSNTPEKRENEVFKDPLETLWKNCIFGLCGVQSVYRKNFRVIVTSTVARRAKWLKEVEEITIKYFPGV